MKIPRGREAIWVRHLLCCSDFHSGSAVGLLNPDTVLVRADKDGQPEEWTPELTDAQEELWPAYVRTVGRAAGLSTDLVVAHGGDATQGMRWDNLIPNVSVSDQREIAVWSLMPLARMRKVRSVALVTGTEVHVPDCAEARIAMELHSRTGKECVSFHHGRVEMDGHIIDMAHHGPPPGSRDWLRGNAALWHLRDRVYLDRRLGKRPADLYLYGHYHDWVHVVLPDCWEGEHRLHHLVIVPSFQGRSRYADKSTRSLPYLTVGMALVGLGNELTVTPLTETWDLRVERSL